MHINGFEIEKGRCRYLGDPNITELVIPDGVREVSMWTLKDNKNIRRIVFPEGVEPWLANVSVQEKVLSYDILPNTGADERNFVIQLCPKDNPGFEIIRKAELKHPPG